MSENRRSRSELRKMRESQQKRKKKPMKKWLKWGIITILTLFLAGAVFGAGLFIYYASSAPELNEDLLKDPISAEFYDMNGELFATIGVENRKYVEYDEIPQEMVDAILATEDARFFDHFGIDVFRLGKAVMANLTGGFGSQGASTITQQVVKNSFLSNEKTLKRKAQEAWLAIQLERMYSKEEIFEMYFNKVLISGNIYGFATGAEYFFGKDLDELELDEIALLAGMPQSPNNYNPFKNPDRAQKRRDIVLNLMVQHGKITEAEAEEAKKVDVTSRLLPEEQRKGVAGTKYDAFLDIVLNEIEEKDPSLLSEGIKVYTTLDPKAQSVVENIMNSDSNFPTETIQSGIAVVDTKTGALRAVGGGRNYGAGRGYNYADDAKRQPGSTMKPLVAYGPAIEYLKWSTGKTIVDEPYKYSNGKAFGNWDGKYFGTITVREALYASRNIPAVKTLQEVGTNKAKDFISKLGIDAENVYESDAIGGGDIHLSPIQLASAYAAFGNNGVYNKPHTIKEIVFRDGSKITNKAEPVVAMNNYTAYMITDMLRDVVSSKPNATGTAARVSGLDIAGKTGTTNYDSDEFRTYNLPSTAVPDSWFVGYSTNYSIAIWSGYEKRKDPITTWDERRLPQVLFSKIMSQISEGKETKRFTKPSSVVEATIEVGTEPLKLASEHTPSDKRRTELFVRGTEPTEVSDEYKEEDIGAPFNLQAVNHTPGLVDLTWDYTVPEDYEDANVQFEVSMTSEDGKSTIVTTTAEKRATVSGIEAGKTYTFTVVAIIDDVRSSPASVTIKIDGGVEEPDVESPDGADEPSPPNNNNGNGNQGKPGGNNNGGNNGNNGGNNNGNNGGNNGGNNNGNHPNPGNGNGNNNNQNDGNNQGVNPPAEPAPPTQTQ